MEKKGPGGGGGESVVERLGEGDVAWVRAGRPGWGSEGGGPTKGGKRGGCSVVGGGGGGGAGGAASRLLLLAGGGWGGGGWILTDHSYSWGVAGAVGGEGVGGVEVHAAAPLKGGENFSMGGGYGLVVVAFIIKVFLGGCSGMGPLLLFGVLGRKGFWLEGGGGGKGNGGGGGGGFGEGERGECEGGGKGKGLRGCGRLLAVFGGWGWVWGGRCDESENPRGRGGEGDEGLGGGGGVGGGGGEGGGGRGGEERPSPLVPRLLPAVASPEHERRHPRRRHWQPPSSAHSHHQQAPVADL